MVESTPPASHPDPRVTDKRPARAMAGDADEDEDDPSQRLFPHEPVAAAAAAMDDGDGDEADEDDPGLVDLAASDGSDDDDDGGSENSDDRALINESGSESDDADALANFVAVDQARDAAAHVAQMRTAKQREQAAEAADAAAEADAEEFAALADPGDGLANFVAVDQERSEPGTDSDHDGDTQIVEIVETQSRGARHVHYRAVDGQDWHWRIGVQPMTSG